MDLSNLRLMNAAGWCKDIATVRKLAKTPVSEITVGSITKEPRSGNEGSVFWQSPDDGYALNSLGLPNPGLEKYREMLPKMRAIANDSHKMLRVSIAGFSPAEYAELALAVSPYADAIEINLGCPNVWGEGGQKPIASFNPDLTRFILYKTIAALDEISDDPVLAVKLSPYSDPSLLGEIAGLLVDFPYPLVEIVSSNTFPNAFAWDGEKTAITPGDGLAGMSGKAMKAIALGQCARLHKLAAERGVTIVGVGAISCGADILDFMRLGINAVQVGTHYFQHGEKVFSELLAECVELA